MAVRANRAANGPAKQRLQQRAIELYQASTAQGGAQAQCNLAYCYQHGDGVKQSVQRAVELYRAAADQGHARA